MDDAGSMCRRNGELIPIASRQEEALAAASVEQLRRLNSGVG